MLTLLETIDALRALDVDADVLRSAATQVLDETSGELADDASAIARDIVRSYGLLRRTSGVELATGAMIASARVFAHICNKGAEAELMKDAVECIFKPNFISSRTRWLLEKHQGDYVGTLDALLNLLPEIAGVLKTTEKK